MIIDKHTKTTWTILAIALLVFSEIGFKTFQPSGSKGHVYMRNKKRSANQLPRNLFVPMSHTF